MPPPRRGAPREDPEYGAPRYAGPPPAPRGPEPAARPKPGPVADTHAFELAAPDQPEPPRRARDAGRDDATAAFGLNKSPAGTAVAPRRQRSAASPAGRSRVSSRRTSDDERTGRRSGLRLGPKGWLWTGAGVAAIAAIAVVAMTLLGSGPSGPAHTLLTPTRLGAFSRSTQLTKQMDVAQLERNIIAQSSGQASHLVSAVYQAGTPVSGGSPTQVMLFIGGQLSGASPDASVKSFTQHFKGASLTSAGSLGGEAACVPAQTATDGSTVCAWFDNNTFGELVSPNMSISTLANELRTVRPSVEHVVKS
jgi:hypothetical protein